MYSGPLYLTSDHAGFKLKQRLVRFLKNELNFEATDMGPKEFDPEDDFPDYAIPTAKKAVAASGRAIFICGSGNGICIAANKVDGMQAALGYSIEAAELARKHGNTNGLCLAAHVLTEDHALAIVKKWLETDFSVVEKYDRRNKKIAQAEKRA